MTDDIVARLMNYMPHHKEVNLAELMLDAADEIQQLQAESDIVLQLKKFVSLWWDDPMQTAKICAAWDQLPENVRMWVLDD